MSPQPITENTLFYGDNLNILREYIATESIDLIYLDPPFNSSRSYNVLFKDESGTDSEAQITAFEDTWHWNPTTGQAYHELVTQSPDHISKMIAALHDFIGENQMMAYLVMMAARLTELHRVLKPTGSLYLHCDPTASHYLKIILDTIFDIRNFRNEIIWKRTNVHSDAKHWSPVNDTILFYTKGTKFIWNPPYAPHSDHHLESKYSFTDSEGRRYTLSDMTSPNPRPNMMYEWLGYSSPPIILKHTTLHPRLEALQNIDFSIRTNRPWDKLIEVVKLAITVQPTSIAHISESIPLYIKDATPLLDSSKRADRIGAIDILAQSNHPAAREVLVKALNHSLRDVRSRVALVLSDEPQSAPALVEALQDKDKDVRQQAAKH